MEQPQREHRIDDSLKQRVRKNGHGDRLRRHPCVERVEDLHIPRGANVNLTINVVFQLSICKVRVQRSHLLPQVLPGIIEALASQGLKGIHFRLKSRERHFVRI